MEPDPLDATDAEGPQRPLVLEASERVLDGALTARVEALLPVEGDPFAQDAEPVPSRLAA